jgi:hypothetical protein
MWGLQVDGAGGLVDGGDEQSNGGPGGRSGGGSGRAVKPDDGVKVDDAAPLVLSDLCEGDADLGGERLIGQPGHAGQSPAQGNGEPAPQFGCAGVEKDRAGVVVAVRAQRFGELGVFAGMPLAAGQPVAVRADLAASAGSAPQDPAVFRSESVDQAERRCGERGEHAGMAGDRLRNALAAAQPGADELVCVRPVDLGTGRALGSAAGLAGDGQDAAGLVDGGVAVEQFAGGPVDVVDAAAEQNRLQASTRMPGRSCRGIGGQRWYSSRRAFAGGGRAEADLLPG